MTITATVPLAGAERPNMNSIAFASCLGTIIEWYDFLIYATAAALVFNKVFFPTFTYRTMEEFNQAPPPGWQARDREADYFRLQNEWRLQRRLAEHDHAADNDPRYPNRHDFVIMPAIPWDPYQSDFWYNEIPNELQSLLKSGDREGAARLAQRDHLDAYPSVPHTWAKMAEGRFCGGGLVALKPRVLPALRGILDDLGAARKSPLRLASLLGWDIMPRFALGSLTIAAAERRATAILNAPAGAIASSYPELAVNVDRASDVALANGLLEAAPKYTE